MAATDHTVHIYQFKFIFPPATAFFTLTTAFVTLTNPLLTIRKVYWQKVSAKFIRLYAPVPYPFLAKNKELATTAQRKTFYNKKSLVPSCLSG
jgi:hypothetical protein